jgi:hypothetical protein
MATNCSSCGQPLTIKDVVRNRCRHCNSALQGTKAPKGAHTAPGGSSFIVENFDFLLAAELKKRCQFSM